MSNKKKFSLIALASVLTLGLTGCFNKSPEDKANWITSKISSHLELDEAQEAKLSSLKNEILKAKENVSGKREEHMKQVRDMVNSDYLDKAKIKSLMMEKSDGFGEKIDPVLDKLVDFHASLNAEQKQKIVAFMDEHKDRRGHWGHHRPW